MFVTHDMFIKFVAMAAMATGVGRGEILTTSDSPDLKIGR